MPQLLLASEVDAILDRHMIRLADHDARETPPYPEDVGHRWIGLGTSAVCLESAADISIARFSFERWDGLPPPLNADWPISETIKILLPSGRLYFDSLTAGKVADVFNVGSSGLYHLRIAWRPVEPLIYEYDPEPQAFALAQFWMDAAA